MAPNPLQGGLVYRKVTKIGFWNLQIFNMNDGGIVGEIYTFKKHLFFSKVKKYLKMGIEG